MENDSKNTTLPILEEANQDTPKKRSKISKIATYIMASIILLALGAFSFWFYQEIAFNKTVPSPSISSSPTSSIVPTKIPDITNESAERCKLEPDPGTCFANMPRYYFDESEGICKEFIWGGCKGSVPFETIESCIESCEKE